MNFFLKSISYILHPILTPLLGAIIYFVAAPRFIPDNIIKVKLIGLAVLTILIPIVLFFFLKNLKLLPTGTLENLKHRKIPLIFQSALLIVVLKIIIDVYHYPELYFFFLGILFSMLSCLFMILFNIKASLHMIGISGITMFTIALSIHFGMNLILLISFLMIANGLVATSRLHCKSYSFLELILGFLIGVIPQLTLVNLWL